ncbi:hypothetical protein MFP26_18925 [Brenneria sp. MC1SB4.1]|uniref:Uncharacterized protein n=1 Tax=Brenneria tiliae TaxID=2914984 RepID=A0ABT0MY40_9GAMM|nr:hypothetical protein [Brenneria tiliae]
MAAAGPRPPGDGREADGQNTRHKKHRQTGGDEICGPPNSRRTESAAVICAVNTLLPRVRYDEVAPGHLVLSTSAAATRRVRDD